ncbi:U-box domain-containing protein 34-like isoform X6 [Phragmites australis]|uniref:U-box domain-containing protein 34-like isoform X6 n=1 Tax=Phragmites australis TaxID=29695 RepID=UPI002D784E6D|nr:U-box domain-containing protein 34-like isoform X6 [Phragmites australis]
MDEEEVHIAVGKNTRKEKAKILWAAANFPRATIVLVHVHWPSKWMPFNLGGKVLYKFANEKEKEIHRGRETEAMVKMLSQYKSFCGARKVSAHYLTHDDTVAGVVNLIKKLKIKRIVIGSRSMSWQAVVRQCSQVWVVLNGKHVSTSNDHLKHTGSIGYGGSSDILASIHELGDESDGYTTPPSDFVDEITNEEEVIEMDDSDQLVTEAETLTEERTEESTTYEEVEIFAEEGADRSDEIQSFRNITEKAEKIMVVVLSRLEHPHIVRLIGVCPESCSLVYEHLPNGTLLDRLSKGLLWKDRVRILAEQRSALAYLHSSRPHAIIHADLKMTNILLDAGNVSRLGDFGTARVVHVKPLEEETIRRRTNPMGTTGYMDPVFFITGELTTESDVYAFGVVILRLLTGLLDLNIAEQVREAVKMDAVHSVLDASAGAWPEVQAERLLKLALRCCSLERKRRPAITCDAEWRPLDILRAMNTPANKSRKWNSLAS